MGKVQLMFVAVLVLAVFSAFGTELPLPLMLDCSKPDAVRKLEREIRERKYNDALEIYNLQNNVIPELPKHEFRTISISNRNNSGAVDLTPLAGHTPKILSLFSGTFTNLASLETAKIEDLSAHFETVLYADDLSRGDWSALRRLHLSGAKGIFLNLKSAVGLESLELHCGNTDITICLSPPVFAASNHSYGRVGRIIHLQPAHDGPPSTSFPAETENTDFRRFPRRFPETHPDAVPGAGGTVAVPNHSSHRLGRTAVDAAQKTARL